MASTPEDTFVVSPQTIDNLQGDGLLYEITSVVLDNANLPDGTLGDIVVIYWRLTGRGGEFVQIEPFNSLWDGFAALDMFPRAEVVRDIWAIQV